VKCKAHILLSLIALLWAARAEAAKVIIVRPAGASPTLNETLSRLQGEVLSLGLEVAIVERPAPSGANAADARAWVERTAIERDADAVLDVIGAGAPAAVDIWVFQGQPRRAEVSRVVREPDADNAAERLAILCRQGVTTRSDVSETSGRGVGMSAIKQRIDAMRGRLEVDSSGLGTKWTVVLPWSPPEATDLPLRRRSAAG